MKALISHPQIERPRRLSDRIDPAKYSTGLVLALVGLISATLMKGPIQLASAETVAIGWSYTGSLNTPRSAHTATLLPDGRVLVAGGGNNPNRAEFFDSAELYDPATGEWNATGSLNTPRRSHTATLLKDGNVLIVGGVGRAEDPSLNGAELYDPKEGKWSVTGSLNTPRYGHTATLLENGKVLVVGGIEWTGYWFWGEERFLESAELYDPDTGIWSLTGPAFSGDTATLLQNGTVLLLGGGSAELYDPDTETWSSVGSHGGNIERNEHTATLLPDGKVLVAGGRRFGVSGLVSLRSSELYDPETGAWTTTGELNETRSGHTATLLPDGKVLVAGGTRYGDSGFVNLRSSELYDPDKGTWSFAGFLKIRRSGHTATLLSDGIPLLVGGLDRSTLSPLDSVELGNTFAAVTPPKVTMASVAGKKLIVVGENFFPDSVILINGKEQKTRNDDQNPGTTLIGKKAGKKIKPGDRLQVRNPDDTLSEEFIFIGSYGMSIGDETIWMASCGQVR